MNGVGFECLQLHCCINHGIKGFFVIFGFGFLGYVHDLSCNALFVDCLALHKVETNGLFMVFIHL